MTPEEFWNQDDRYRDQKFYVAFCLFESALGDYAVARDLHSHNKLNWASAIYYYSMVHALRLICFITVGDFPTGHSDLAKLYKDGTLENKGRWLSNPRNRGRRLYHFTRSEINQVDLSRDEIARAFGDNEQIFSDLNNKFQKWGEILDKARECRNDSNYEGLIIAHEYGHQLVTNDFERLARILKDTCERVLPEIISLFKIFIDRQTRRESYYSYLNWKEESEGLYYLENSLRFRLLGRRNVQQVNNPIIRDVLEWIEQLRKTNTNTNLASEVWDNINLEVFGGKGLLMQSFREKINELESLES